MRTHPPRKGHFLAGSHIVIIVLPLILGAWQIYRFHITDKLQQVDIYLLNFLWIGVGMQATIAGLMQIFKGEKSAAYLNWPYSPFVHEVGYANLAFGILGLLCLVITGTWWAATGIGYSIFLLCAAWGHVYDLVVNKNYSLGNLGPTLWSDILIPFALLLLISWHHGLLWQRALG